MTIFKGSTRAQVPASGAAVTGPCTVVAGRIHTDICAFWSFFLRHCGGLALLQVQLIKDAIAEVPDGVHGPRKPTKVGNLAWTGIGILVVCPVELMIHTSVPKQQWPSSADPHDAILVPQPIAACSLFGSCLEHWWLLLCLLRSTGLSLGQPLMQRSTSQETVRRSSIPAETANHHLPCMTAAAGSECCCCRWRGDAHRPQGWPLRQDGQQPSILPALRRDAEAGNSEGRAA